jgi:hypothetical protein
VRSGNDLRTLRAPLVNRSAPSGSNAGENAPFLVVAKILTPTSTVEALALGLSSADR